MSVEKVIFHFSRSLKRGIMRHACPELKEPLEGCSLDHIAIAVKDLEKACEIYTQIGFSFSQEREIVKSQGVRVAFSSLGGDAKLELLEPLGEEGPIFQFLKKKGSGGLHHICFRVSCIKEKCRELSRLGHHIVYPKPVLGGQNCLVNFIHPKSTDGVLIELSQAL